MLHSPLLRAVQTADLLSRALAKGGETRVTLALASSPARDLLDEIPAEGLTALVGHEPWMSELCAWLLTGRKRDASMFPFRKGGVAWLEGEPRPGGMTLIAYVPPRLSRKPR